MEFEYKTSVFDRGPENSMFTLIVVIFVLVILFIILRSVFEFISNNRSEEIVTDARVLSKRIDVRLNSGASNTQYFVTFELPSGERKEFRVTGNRYGILVENDRGVLSYQGTRLNDFVR